MRDLVDIHFPKADVIRVVLDNLNIHSSASLYATFEPAEARRFLHKLEFHHAPTRGSWFANVLVGVFPTYLPYNAKSPLGSSRAMPTTPLFSGNFLLKRHAPNCLTFIPHFQCVSLLPFTPPKE
jgi:hypothetical protein